MGLVVSLLVLGVLGGIGWLKSPSGEAWLRAKAEEALNEAMGRGRAELVGLSNAGLGELALERLVIFDDEDAVLELYQAEVAVRLWPLLRGEIRIGRTAVGRVVADLKRESGLLNLQELFSSPVDTHADSGETDFAVDAIEVDAVEIRYRERDLDVLLEKGSFSGGVRSASGGVRLDDIVFQGIVDGESVSLALEEGLVGSSQRIDGLQVEARNSRLTLSGHFSEESLRLEVQEAQVDGRALKEVLGEEWSEGFRIEGLGIQTSDEGALRARVEGLGGVLLVDVRDEGGLIQGRVDAKSVELDRLEPSLESGALLTGSL
ncbi:MAG: hypothetical protein VXW32_13630, partial [Myxococcota bacterium]|nr:hypothetical protein [Myxococcota bacterium]